MIATINIFSPTEPVCKTRKYLMQSEMKTIIKIDWSFWLIYKRLITVGIAQL